MVEQMLVFHCCAQNTYVYQLINNTLQSYNVLVTDKINNKVNYFFP